MNSSIDRNVVLFITNDELTILRTDSDFKIRQIHISEHKAQDIFIHLLDIFKEQYE